MEQLSPIFRLHGAAFHEHTPWSPEIKSTALYRELSKLHIAAEPLIDSLWRLVDETGMPVTRPLYLEYPEDPRAAKQDQEWLLGPEVLVAPVVTQHAVSRAVYFPSGCWRSPETGQEVTGPAELTIQPNSTSSRSFSSAARGPSSLQGALAGRRDNSPPVCSHFPDGP